MHRRYFEILSDWMIAGLARIGVPGVRREGSCDLALGDRKIAGACVYRTRGLLHYGASLLVDPDLSLIERYLRHPPREPAYRRGRGHRDFLAGLAQISAQRDAAQVARALAGVLAPPDLGRRAWPPSAKSSMVTPLPVE
jgi:lipoate-protein ligase A